MNHTSVPRKLLCPGNFLERWRIKCKTKFSSLWQLLSKVHSLGEQRTILCFSRQKFWFAFSPNKRTSRLSLTKLLGGSCHNRINQQYSFREMPVTTLISITKFLLSSWNLLPDMNIQLKLDNMLFITAQMTSLTYTEDFSPLTELNFFLVNLLCRKMSQIDLNHVLLELETHPAKTILKCNAGLWLNFSFLNMRKNFTWD